MLSTVPVQPAACPLIPNHCPYCECLLLTASSESIALFAKGFQSKRFRKRLAMTSGSSRKCKKSQIANQNSGIANQKMNSTPSYDTLNNSDLPTHTFPDSYPFTNYQLPLLMSATYVNS